MHRETLIAGGPFVLPLAAKYGSKILPADSEHSAIFQCMHGLPEGGLRRIILTASGGAFRDLPVEKLADVTVEQAVTHPNWSMGKKITIDSATLMNKGLEVIEAHYLFGVDYDNIDIVIHPQSIIHSMVETADSSVIAQLGWPDMRLPIMHCMSYPERVSVQDATWPRLDFTKANSLTFKVCVCLCVCEEEKEREQGAVSCPKDVATPRLDKGEQPHVQVACVETGDSRRGLSEACCFAAGRTLGSLFSVGNGPLLLCSYFSPPLCSYFSPGRCRNFAWCKMHCRLLSQPGYKEEKVLCSGTFCSRESGGLCSGTSCSTGDERCALKPSAPACMLVLCANMHRMFVCGSRIPSPASLSDLI